MDYITNKEVWKPVKGYEGRYEVSNFGRVKSLKRKVSRIQRGRLVYTTIPERILKQDTQVRGYKAVRLSKNGKEKVMKVHRLVAMSFIENPDDLPQVNHKNENTSDNNVNNLEWCTSKYNVNYGTRKERQLSHPNYLKAIAKNRDRTRIPVKATNIKTGEIKIYEAMKDAEKDGFRQGNITNVCKGDRKNHKGFTWEYI